MRTKYVQISAELYIAGVLFGQYTVEYELFSVYFIGYAAEP
jgi:hypothetical protein